ncbi:DNA topoisomerase, partial [Escherichia coli]|nr:DNA topoisomerase [Escherichia coli]
KGNDQFEGQVIEYQGKKEELSNENDVTNIVKQLDGNEFSISKVTKRERKRNAAPSFTTSSLQQEAARKLNFRAKKTMMIA